MTKQAKKPNYLHTFPYTSTQEVGVLRNCPKCKSFMKKEVEDPDMFMRAGIPHSTSGFRCPKCNHRQPSLEIWDNNKDSVVPAMGTGDNSSSLQTVIDDGEELEMIRKRNLEMGAVLTEAERQTQGIDDDKLEITLQESTPEGNAGLIAELQRLEAQAEGEVLEDATASDLEEFTSNTKTTTEEVTEKVAKGATKKKKA